MSIDIGVWVIETALAQMSSWRKLGLNLHVSVNISAEQLEAPNFIDSLSALLAKYPEISSGDLELEILENSLITDLSKVSEIISTCRSLGVRVALDDFGTGYSSLTYLRTLNVDMLKIDQIFVRNMITNPNDFIILEDFVNLAVAFRREFIAEGVETVSHGTLLLQLGCENAQGYSVSRPISADEIPGWVKNWKTYPEWEGRKPLPRQFLPVLLAYIEHKTWVHNIKNYCESCALPDFSLDSKDCRFGSWLAGEGKNFLELEHNHAALEQLHAELHDLAKEIYGLHETGTECEKIAPILDKLSKTSDLLLEELERIVKYY